MIILEEVEVGLDKDSIWVPLEEMIEAAVDQDQIQEQVLIEIESDALSVGNIITLQRLSRYIRYRKRAVIADAANAYCR